MVWISWFMVFNNISVISWRSVLLVEESGENHRPVVSHWQILSHNVVTCMQYTLPWTGFELATFSGDRHWFHRYKCSCKSNYHTITTTTTPHLNWEMYAMYSICKLMECCYLGFRKNGKHLLGTVYFNNKYVCGKTLINWSISSLKWLNHLSVPKHWLIEVFLLWNDWTICLCQNTD